MEFRVAKVKLHNCEIGNELLLVTRFHEKMNVYDQAKCIFSLIRMDNSIFKGYFESKVVYLLHILFLFDANLIFHKSTEFYI